MNRFQRYLTRRAGYIIVTMFTVSLLVFAVTQILPGNAAVMMLGKYASEKQLALVEKQLGLNRPVYVQYIDWLGDFVTLNWGQSYSLHEPVLEIVKQRAIRSIQLVLLTLLALVFTAIPLGVIAAYYRDTAVDKFVTGTSYIGISSPEFVTGLVLLLVFSNMLNFFPTGGYTPPSEGLIPWLKTLVLPTATLTILLTAHVIRLTRSEMIETLQSDYVRTARLKGLKNKKIIVKHALRNGLMPTITILALDVGYLLGGIVVVEEVFSFPGIGRLVVISIQNRDIPTIQIVVLLIALTYSVANLAADLLYSYLDPRIDLE